MKIGINAFGCDHGKSGLGSYVYSIVNNLPGDDTKVEIFGPEFDRYTYNSGVESVTYEGVSIDDTEFAESVWHKTSLNKFLSRQTYDAVLFPAGIRLLPMGNFVKPSFLVIQDFVETTHYAPYFGFFARTSIKKMLSKATGVIAPSNYIKSKLVSIGVPEYNVKVIYNGIDTNIFYPRKFNKGVDEFMQSFSVRRPYIIYASRISDPEKRHVELIKGFSVFKKKTGAPHRLVIAGTEGKNAKAVHAAVMDSPFSSDILLTGYIEHAQLANLYLASSLCIFPSEVEGVGLSVIEAMACGIPVACSNSGALPEIAGKAAWYFNSRDPMAIAKVLEQLNDTSESATNKRNKMVESGLEWVKRYSWTKTSKQTFDYISSKL